MKAVAVFMCLMIFPVFIYADNKTDLTIFKAEAQLARAPEKTRIVRFNDIARRFVEISPEVTIEYSNRVLVLARQIHDRDAEVTALSNIAAAYDAMGYGNVALLYYQKALKAFSISVDEKERMESIVFNTGALAAGIFGSVFLFVICLIWRYRRLYNKEKYERVEKQKHLQLESKLKLYQARTHPHFLFNSLDSIVGHQGPDDTVHLKESVIKLSRIYRAILKSPEMKVIPLKNELELVKDYLEVEKEILGGRLNYKITFNEELLNCEILPLTILTLVENAVKHGIHKKSDGGLIDIRIFQHNEALSIEVNDTGKGFDVNTVQYGFGIYSIQERLKLFYRNRAKLKLESIVEGGTQAIMEVPYARFQYGEN